MMELAEKSRNIHKTNINSIFLAFLIVLTVCFLQGYGIWASNMGYSNLMVKGYGEKVALAVLAIRDGFFPWNVLSGESPVTGGFYFGETNPAYSSGFPAAGFSEVMDHWGLREIAEWKRLAEEDRLNGDHLMGNYFTEDRLTGECVADHLLRHSLLEDMLGHSDMGLPENVDFMPPLVIGTVEESYFADAVFIGDSRMQGVYEYAGMEEADFLAKVSMTIYNMMNTKVSTNGHNETVREALTERQYGKIYIMVGINELGTADTEYFIRNYQAVLEEIRTLQPDALIVIQAVMHVTGEMDREDPIINNTNINERNAALKELANGYDIFYIDVNEAYDDENGNLRQDMTADNVHLLGNCYELWHTFYLEHGIVYESIGEE